MSFSLKEAEKSVKTAIRDILNAHHCWYCMPIGTKFGRAGIPDFVCCKDGKFFAIEAKINAKAKPRENQIKELEAITKAGGTSLVIHAGNIAELNKFLNELKKDS